MSKITRRDFVNGTLVAAGSSLLPLANLSQTAMAAMSPSYYPPALTGLRGSHPSSNIHAHAKALDGKADWGVTSRLNEEYDLIVVGGGLSGLAAGYYYQQEHGADKKILILDNHDDFGGHAKRTEHTVNGKTLITYGGSQSIVEPNHASPAVKRLFRDIGVDPKRFETAYDRNFYQANGLRAGTFFNQGVFGEDKVVLHPFCNYPNYVEGILMSGRLTNEEAVQQTPLTARGKEQLLRALSGGLHAIDVPKKELQKYIRSTNYFDYLKNDLEIDDPDVLRMARNSGLDWASAPTELMSVAGAKGCGAMGFAPKAVYDENNPYIYHFPGGNAGVTRALVKKMIPNVAEGSNAEELVMAKFDYAELDKPNNRVRIRLNSTVVNVRHGGTPEDSSDVMVSYISDNKSYQIRGKAVVMACYNMIIPHLVPDLPKAQSQALSLQMKSPLQYSSVGLRNWKAFKELELGLAMSPGNMHQVAFMDFPVSMGGYQYSQTPDQPCVVQMISCPYGETYGAPEQEQYEEARYMMLDTEFSEYEEEIRGHLSGMLPKSLFNADRDIESITVNRWAHGYTVSGPRDSVEKGRQPFGRITIANCDSAPGADLKTAFDMAWRAVKELG
jgi:spermidine dehydrogenase